MLTQMLMERSRHTQNNMTIINRLVITRSWARVMKKQDISGSTSYQGSNILPLHQKTAKTLVLQHFGERSMTDLCWLLDLSFSGSSLVSGCLAFLFPNVLAENLGVQRFNDMHASMPASPGVTCLKGAGWSGPGRSLQLDLHACFIHFLT